MSLCPVGGAGTNPHRNRPTAERLLSKRASLGRRSHRDKAAAARTGGWQRRRARLNAPVGLSERYFYRLRARQMPPNGTGIKKKKTTER